jgi:hypothetical protein
MFVVGTELDISHMKQLARTAVLVSQSTLDELSFAWPKPSSPGIRRYAHNRNKLQFDSLHKFVLHSLGTLTGAALFGQ